MTTDEMGKVIFGMSRTEAHQQGICIACKQPVRHYTNSGLAEYRISGMCEYCFDKLGSEDRVNLPVGD